MRTLSQIELIKNRISNPYSVENFLSRGEIDHLVTVFQHTLQNDSSRVTYKNTGPVTINLNNFLEDQVIIKVLESIKSEIGNYEVTSAFFFQTDYPHIIHNDDTFELPDTVYKAITIPLQLTGSDIPKLCFFDQFYFHGPAKFFNGSTNVPTYYNQQVYDYKNVDGVVPDLDFDSVIWSKYLTHLKPKWLTGLTFWGALDWIPGNAIIFDSTRLHCASDFRQQGITSKLAISIFTKIL